VVAESDAAAGRTARAAGLILSEDSECAQSKGERDECCDVHFHSCSFYRGSRAAWPCCVAVMSCMVALRAGGAPGLKALETKPSSAGDGCSAALAGVLDRILFLIRAH
jgi:hypothetical protein